MAFTKSIDSNWQFTQLGGGKGTKQDEWLTVASFPTTVHVELKRLGRIPDPFLGLNEWEVQWVGESQWAFKTTFELSKHELAKYKHFDIVFDGLDTFATAKLNGHEIVKSDNQFVAYRASVGKLLNPGANELFITFENAFAKGRDLQKQHPGTDHLWNGDASRLHVRKAQYNYGWDWGPVLMTAGPWRPIRLEGYDLRITDVDARVNVSEALDTDVNVTVQISDKNSHSGQVSLYKPNGEVQHTQKIQLQAGSGKATFSFKKGEVALWYPVGYGEQPIYKLEVVIIDEDTSLALYTQGIGIRRARVVEDTLVDQEGRTFLFEINNTRVFCGGSNWIPADSFLTEVTDQRYRQWLELLVRGNQNMIRVWGGGIYEPDVFYRLCDELGILVWQDFMFACGQYPAYDSFPIKDEAEQTVQRLRKFSSVVIFTGNNEDYQVAESIPEVGVDYSDETSDFRNSTFPARHIYERVLPEIVNRLSDIHYHRASPYSGYGKNTRDRTVGDIHQWNVWHGSQEPWHNWDILSGRFISEFGMQGFPNARTVDYWLDGNTDERHPQSRLTQNHNKADGYERRIETYLIENFKYTFDMDDYIFYTQAMQAETLAAAYRLWRRNWKGRGREYTAGALVWQLNDCWPVTSWAIADYFLRPKPAYFSIARELRPYTVGMARKDRTVYASEFTAADFKLDVILDIWGTNSTLAEKKITLDVTCYDLRSDWTEQWSKEATLVPNASTELFQDVLPGQPTRTKLSEVPKTIVVSARLIQEDGVIIARYSNWPEPFKFVNFPSKGDVGLKVVPNGDSVELSTSKPVKGIILDVDGAEVEWSDQAIDLVPNDPQVIQARGLNGRPLKVRYVGDGGA